jgi:tRNA dimethylallyltransferase
MTEPHATEEREPATARIVVLTGATAVGKSELALALAARWEGEIISADSRLVYHYLDIGTAKPTVPERAVVPHHLINVAYPDEPYSVVAYQRQATTALWDIAARGLVVLVVGGSPHYIQSLIDRLQPAPRNPRLRAWLDRADAAGATARLDHWLATLDPIAAQEIDLRNRRRVLRALEVILTTGRPFSQVGRRHANPFPAVWIGLRRDRHALHERIDRRVAAMVAAGWMEEVRTLLAMGLRPELPALSATGYGALAAALVGRATLDDALTRIRIATHAFARRQESWLRAEPRLTWFDAADPALAERVAAVVESAWEQQVFSP